MPYNKPNRRYAYCSRPYETMITEFLDETVFSADEWRELFFNLAGWFSDDSLGDWAEREGIVPEGYDYWDEEEEDDEEEDE